MKEKQPKHAENKRRKLLKTVVISGGAVSAKGLPGSWTSPTVESMVLPAHAQMSGASLTDPCESVLVNTTLTTFFVSVQGVVVGSGNADVGGITMNIEVTVGAHTETAQAVTNAAGMYGPEILGDFDVCNDGVGTVFVTVSSDHPLLQGQTASCNQEHEKSTDAC